MNWSKFNETDIREEIISPLLRRLGYQTDTENNIVREQYLKYEKSYLGHKNPKKDWPLIGKADYVCEARKRVRWTIEAKSPDNEISVDDIEQAYTYARHPEVRAVYFCICNGRELRVYATANAPTVAPILILPFEEFDKVENLLAPDSVIRHHPDVVPDSGKPIGPGLRSIVQITGGHIVFQEGDQPLPSMNGYTIYVVGGVVQRSEHRLLAFLDTLSPFESLQKLNERLGLAKFEISSEDSNLSTDDNQPTIFQSNQTVIFAKGEKLYNFIGGQDIILPINLTCEAKTFAQGVLKNSEFTGEFRVQYNYLESEKKINMIGKFIIQLS